MATINVPVGGGTYTANSGDIFNIAAGATGNVTINGAADFVVNIDNSLTGSGGVDNGRVFTFGANTEPTVNIAAGVDSSPYQINADGASLAVNVGDGANIGIINADSVNGAAGSFDLTFADNVTVNGSIDGPNAISATNFDIGSNFTATSNVIGSAGADNTMTFGDNMVIGARLTASGSGDTVLIVGNTSSIGNSLDLRGSGDRTATLGDDATITGNVDVRSSGTHSVTFGDRATVTNDVSFSGGASAFFQAGNDLDITDDLIGSHGSDTFIVGDNWRVDSTFTSQGGNDAANFGFQSATTTTAFTGSSGTNGLTITADPTDPAGFISAATAAGYTDNGDGTVSAAPGAGSFSFSGVTYSNWQAAGPTVPDGKVDGTAGDDDIAFGYTDADGDQVGSGADTVYGYDGNDTINSGNGDDTLFGGDGNDTFLPGPGADSIDGGAGNDVVSLSDSDSVDGGTGFDSFDATFGAFGETVTFDSATGGTTDNGTTFTNMEGFVSGDGADTYDASLASGDLYIKTGNEDDSVIGGSGNDTINGGDGADTLAGGAGNDSILAGTGNDSVTGDTGADTIQGNAGNDTIDGGAGDDLIYGDTAPGTFVVQGFEFNNNFTADPAQLGSFSPLVVDITGDPVDIVFLDDDAVLSNDPNSEEFASNDATQTVLVNGVEYAANIEATALFDGDDLNTYELAVVQVDLNGNDTADASTSEQGYYLVPIGTPPPAGVSLTYTSADFTSNQNYADLFGAGAAGNDTLNGGDGTDAIYGGAGDDTLDGGLSNDSLFGGIGDDTILLNDGYLGDNIFGGEDADTLDIDTLDASGVTTDGVDVFISGGESGSVTSDEGTANFQQIERFVLTGQNDTFDGNFTTAALTVEGGAGNDTMTGGAGENTLYGGDGDDVFTVGIGNDAVFGGAGSDTIVADDPIVLTFTADGLGNFADIPDSDNGNFQEIEVIQGSAGDDTINASGDSAGVTLFGNGGADQITGGSGDDSLSGGDGNDTIDAGAGRDTLDGGAGNDTLTGGSGPDVFIADGTADVITDFDTTTGIDGGVNTDNDFVDLTSFYNAGTLATFNGLGGATYTTALGWLRADQADGVLAGAGNLQIEDGGSAVAGSELNAENTGVVCFTSGTAIRTPRGDVVIDELRIGDLVSTMDNGAQRIRWIGRSHFGPQALQSNPKLRPVLIPKGVMSTERDLLVSRQHAMLMNRDQLVRAIHLVDINGLPVRVANGKKEVTYIHLMFEEHEVIFAENVPSESFYPGPCALSMMDPAEREELMLIFPDIASNTQAYDAASAYGPTVRNILRPKDIPSVLGTHSGRRKRSRTDTLCEI